MKKHILVVSQYFYPEQFRINDMVKDWVDRGYQVTVLTGIPNYPEGKFYEGYGILKKRQEDYCGANIIRVPLIPRGDNAVTLSLNYLSFVVSGYVWQVFNNIKADYVFIFEVSPMTQALPAVSYAKKRKIPCFIYVQDLWPENFEMLSGIQNKKIISSIGKMVDYIYKECTLIFTTSKSFVSAIHGRGVPLDKLVYWPQYSEEFYKPVNQKSIPEIDENHFNFIFTGNIGASQGLDILVEVSKRLDNHQLNKNIIFNIVGDGRYRENLEKKIEESQVTKYFNFIGRQPAERIPELLSSSNVAFLSLKADPIFEKTIPAKLQSYMSCGKPILASANGETTDIIDEAQAGFYSPAGDVEALEEKILKLVSMNKEQLNELGRNSLDYANKNFNKQKLMDRMDDYLESVGG